jgi:acetoin utilization deacetylase AcuC-like enzyme
MKNSIPKRAIRTAFSESYFAKTPQPSMRKLPLVAREISDTGFAAIVEPEPVSRADLERIHDAAYVESILSGEGPLSQCAFGYWSESYRDGVLAINGGNLLAARMALEDGIAANVAQGFHHAAPPNGGGFCTFNGLALVAAMRPDLDVFILDCDEHGGDGTAEFTKALPNLFNFSICGSTMGAFEGPRSIVRKVPEGDESLAHRYLDEALSLISERRPGLVIYQAGMDPHCDDPLSRSKMSGNFLARRDELVMESLALELAIPFFFVLAGGYQEPMEEKLVPLHVRTFEIAARVHALVPKKCAPPVNVLPAV